MNEISVQKVADAMYELVKEYHGKKSLKAMDLIKAMREGRAHRGGNHPRCRTRPGRERGAEESMALLKKSAQVNPRSTATRGGSGAAVSALRPQPVMKTPPCMETCPSGSNIRGWISTIAQREKLGLSSDQALEKSWRMIVDKNPFPSTLGRVCPPPCEKECSRALKDGSVSINAMEQFLGDWALEHKLALNKLEEDVKPESIGVIGAGPAGLSFAYQLARRGYQGTVYEKTDKAGRALLTGD